MSQSILFDPMVPLPVLLVLAAVSSLAIGVSLWGRLPGWGFRGLAALFVLATLAGPIRQEADQTPLSDIVLVALDQSASNKLSDRPDQMAAARDALSDALSDRPNTDVRWITVPDSADDGGTQLLTALREALANAPRARVAGIIALSDGQVHDLEQAPNLPAPLHLLHTGRRTDWDRRLIVRNAPSFGIIDEPLILTLRIEDAGAVPEEQSHAQLDIVVDGDAPQRVALPVGRDFELPVTLPHGGRNVIEFRTPTALGELTGRNNVAVVQINGVRDRLRVLLVSGAPHPGGRVWRNLLKSDSSVDLVHFTILRPPEKQDGVPVEELSLIAFPTRELFLEKIDDFDLIILDRYKRRGILPTIYLENIVNYVRDGGALLLAAGPDFAGADSIFRTPLADILPARPSARVLEQAYRPAVTQTGGKHPVTAELEGRDSWGHWLRLVDLAPKSGHTLMQGVGDRPLLVLDRVQEGRVALLASDHAWLWSRGYDGGGPQLELLRRLSHWMMKEPELEEEVLHATASGQSLVLRRRSLGDSVGAVEILRPDGETETHELTQTAPGLWEGRYEGPMVGLYQLREGDQETVIGLGPRSPRELETPLATGDVLAPLIRTWRGGTMALEDGVPKLRSIREGRPAAGRGWIGLLPRQAAETTTIRQSFLLPPWLVLLLAMGTLVLAWLREGRR